jgi:DNA mismatch repair protein MutS2
VKDRELRAQLEKSTRRKMQDVRSEAREELNVAVVQTISESQADLGVHAASLEAVSPDRLQAGTKIRVRGFTKPVIFRRLDGSSAEIEAGPLRMKVALDEITGIEAAGAQSSAKGAVGAGLAPPASTVTVRSQPRETVSTDEINVIGMTVEQATELVDKFLDDAALEHKPRVRIIHGHGTGALRRGLAEFFAAHPLVERIHAEADDRGGSAVTVVELKD